MNSFWYKFFGLIYKKKVAAIVCDFCSGKMRTAASENLPAKRIGQQNRT
jgi:hypothetical protein